MTTCAKGGFLVDGTRTLPPDPTVLDVEGLPVLGCSRLRCPKCGQAVRSAAGLSFASREEVSGAQLANLYATADLASSPLLQRVSADVRLYVCRCARWLETSQHALVVEDRDPGDPDLAWRCDGHPAIALPHEIAGTMVRTAGELETLVVRGLHDDVPPGVDRADRARGEWLARLHAQLSPADARVVAGAAAACIGDAEPRTRALALHFFYLVPDPRGLGHVMDVLEAHPELFVGVADPVTTIEVDTTLEHSAWRVLGPLVGQTGQVRDKARAAALAGRANLALYDVLSKYDSAWVTEHGAEVAKAAPERARDLLDSLSQFPDGVPTKAVREAIRKAVGR